jgi:hypothetical protein
MAANVRMRKCEPFKHSRVKLNEISGIDSKLFPALRQELGNRITKREWSGRYTAW